MFISREHEKGAVGVARCARACARGGWRGGCACMRAGAGAGKGPTGGGGKRSTPELPRALPHAPPPPRSPGPITASPTSAMGRQVVSTKSSAPAPGFGTGRRLAEHSTDVPGPGAYNA